MSASASFDWSWIPGTVAAATGMIVAIDVGRRAEKREKAAALREQHRLAGEKGERRRQLEREAALRLVKLFRMARHSAIAPDEVDFEKTPISEDDYRVVEYRREFGDEFPGWWEQSAAMSVDVELITDDATRNAIRLCVRAIANASSISKLGGWGDIREITRDVSEVAFEVLGFWLRDATIDDATQQHVNSVAGMVKAHDDYVRSLFER